MTTLYFVRHAKILYTEDDFHRPLSEEGLLAVPKVASFFRDIHVDAMVSSPYVRAIHTIQGVSDDKDLEISLYHDLRERKVAHTFIDDFESFALNQWQDFDFKLDGGESLGEVQKRGRKVISDLLEVHKGQAVVVGTHGTFLALQLNYYDKKYDMEFWRNIQLPDIFKFVFDDKELVSIERLELEC